MCSSIFGNSARTAGLIGTGVAPFDAPKRRNDDGACHGSIGGTWHMPIGTLLIFSLFANNVRTAGLIGMGEALIDVFRPREGDGAC